MTNNSRAQRLWHTVYQIYNDHPFQDDFGVVTKEGFHIVEGLDSLGDGALRIYMQSGSFEVSKKRLFYSDRPLETQYQYDYKPLKGWPVLTLDKALLIFREVSLN